MGESACLEVARRDIVLVTNNGTSGSKMKVFKYWQDQGTFDQNRSSLELEQDHRGVPVGWVLILEKSNKGLEVYSKCSIKLDKVG